MIKIDLFSATHTPYNDKSKLQGEISYQVLCGVAATHLAATDCYRLVILDFIREKMGVGENFMLTFDEESEEYSAFRFSKMVKDPETGKENPEFVRNLTDDEIAFIKPITDKYTALSKSETAQRAMNTH